MSNRRQPQRLPPPIMYGGEAIDSESVLREFPEDQALVLWKTVRAVRLWADLEEGDRSRAFAATAHQSRMEHLKRTSFPDEILVSVSKAATVLQPRARPTTVAAACRAIANWALEREALGTAMEFQQAAAMALPEEAELAFEAAWIARRRGEYARAETWYRHAIARARRVRNWHEFARAYIGLGTVATLRGNYTTAKRSLIRGVRAAKRFALWPLVAAGYHELAVFAIRRQSTAEVARYTHFALEAYGPAHPRLPALAFDYGVFLLDSGYPEEALRTLKSVPPEFGRASDRLARAAELARAAGAVSDGDTFEAAWATAVAFLEEPSAATSSATAYLSLSRGAASLGDLERAEQAALDARRIAAERDEADVAEAAESLLQSIRTGATADAATERTQAPSKLRQLVKEFEARSEAIRLV